MVVINLLPNLWTIQPANGRAIKAPSGSENRTAPSSASL